MENTLHAYRKGMKIGKIPIHHNGDENQLIYEKLQKTYLERHVILVDS